MKTRGSLKAKATEAGEISADDTESQQTNSNTEQEDLEAVDAGKPNQNKLNNNNKLGRKRKLETEFEDKSPAKTGKNSKSGKSAAVGKTPEKRKWNGLSSANWSPRGAGAKKPRTP